MKNVTNTINPVVNNLKKIFMENRWFQYSILLFLLIFSILRGIRFPNSWSYTHYLFNYDFGFVKRGFIGSIVELFDSPYLKSYEFFFLFSAAIFIANMILLIVLIRDFLKSKDPLLVWSSLVFASSLCVVFLSHSIGYFDHIGLLVVLVSLKIKGFYKKMFFLFLSLPIVLLIHEAFLVIFFPVIFMSLVFNINHQTDHQTDHHTDHHTDHQTDHQTEDRCRIRKMILLGVLSVLSVLLVFVLGNHTLKRAEITKMYRNVQDQSEHPLRRDAFNVLERDSRINIIIMKKTWSQRNRFIKLGKSLLVTAPVFAFFIFYAVYILKRSRTGFFLIILTVAASLSPLLLNFIGSDMNRWNTLAILTAFLMLHQVYSREPRHQPAGVPKFVYIILFLLVVFNMVATIPLFDGYYVKQFPFLEHLEYISDLLHGQAIFPHVPR
jgi:hypothetical protein